MISNKVWEVTLNECPHCNLDLSIKSSCGDLKESIRRIILMSQIHIKNCRGNNKAKISKLYIKEIEKHSYITNTYYRFEKILL